ncbi:hypothetical protein [Mesorhizobium sp.]|uniref:hypothetical protein n=1 Tax=Mesorhizobium sp. TaxID=1871066 RepID=UPI0025DDB7D0|nr:hypothetical protein [Mesorhizobium sp.]
MTNVVSPLFTPAETANFLAGKAVASATSFLDGRSTADVMRADADRLMHELLAVDHQSDANAILDPARLLVLSMMRTARASERWRLDRWQQVTAALVELVRRESTDLRERGVQRS